MDKFSHKFSYERDHFTVVIDGEEKVVTGPASWSHNSVSIVAQKYMRVINGVRENDVDDVVRRVVDTIATWGIKQKRFTFDEAEEFASRLHENIIRQNFSFNSPVWFNVGVKDTPQCSACFILSVDDTMQSILDWNTKEGLIFKGGSGSGTNLSKIRGSMEKLSIGGVASGPVSFMRGADAWAGAIKSGGGTRRAAKMVVLDVDHPDIEEFIWCKSHEEKKMRALQAAGFDIGMNGKDITSIAFQNANNSVRVTDEFMRAVIDQEDFELRLRKPDESGNRIAKRVKAADLLRQMAEAAWQCADPGIQYDDTIQRWHTLKNTGRIEASNPCSEYMSINDSACNLASINIDNYMELGMVDLEGLTKLIDDVFEAMDIIIDESSYPTDEITRNAKKFRQLGLGFTNAGAMLMKQGLPYDSEAGRNLVAAFQAFINARAYHKSARMAGSYGPYEGYSENKEHHDLVMSDHHAAVLALRNEIAPVRDHDSTLVLLDNANALWEETREVIAPESGYRNSQATVIAPTGTISFMMGCDTTGIEPGFSLVTYKSLVGGGIMKMVNNSVRKGVEKLGYNESRVNEICERLENEGILELDDQHHYDVFETAVEGEKPEGSIPAVRPLAHIMMMEKVQPHVSGAISKTINMPESSTVDDIMEIFIQGWKRNLKALAVYRDGSKTFQAISTSGDSSPADFDENIDPVRRKKLPRTRESVTHKFSIAGHEGYITAGMYGDGSVGEIFLSDIGKQGSTLRGMCDAFSIAFSIALQHGAPLEVLVRKFSNMRFAPEGITEDKDIRFAKSLPDYLVRWLASEFLSHDTELMSELGIVIDDEPSARHALEAYEGESSADEFEIPTGAVCTDCGGLMVRTGACETCTSCGTTTSCG